MRLPSVARQIDRDGNERRFGGNCGFYSVPGLTGDDGVPHAARSSLIVVGRRIIPTVMLNEQRHGEPLWPDTVGTFEESAEVLFRQVRPIQYQAHGALLAGT